MIRFSKEKRINLLVIEKIKSGWNWRNGKKHKILISPNNHIIPIPSTPSDRRAYYNFYRDLRILENNMLSH